MNVNEVELTISAVRPEQYPDANLPEIALSGRSNVGKSSLINRLINRSKLARTSSQPGKTQTLNFYKVEQALYLVDVPGYGYAKVSKTERERWGKMIETYLTQREQLKGVVVLVDARHDPTEDDVAMYQFLQYYQIQVLVVATKADKVSRSRWAQCVSQAKKVLHFNPVDSFVLFSAETGMGKEEVWQWVDSRSGLTDNE